MTYDEIMDAIFKNPRTKYIPPLYVIQVVMILEDIGVIKKGA